MKMNKKVLINIILLVVFSTAVGQSTSNKRTSTVTTNDGISISYNVYGSGLTTLVFVHGWSCDKSYWREQITPFSKDYKVVTVDLAVHGESGLGRKDWTIQSFGKDVATVINELKLTKVILIGHSMGGDVIVDTALEIPERLMGLVMVDTYKKLGTGREPEQIEIFVNTFREDFPSTVKTLVRSMFLSTSDSLLVDSIANDMASAPPEVALSALKSSFTHSRQITHDLEHLTIPVITINPDNEPTDIESMQIHGVKVLITKGTGHFLMLENPEKFNNQLEKVIAMIVGE